MTPNSRAGKRASGPTPGRSPGSSILQGAPYERASGEIGTRARARQDVIRRLVCKRHEARANDPVLLVEKTAGAELAEWPPVARRMPRAHLEHGAPFEFYAHHMMRAHGRVASGNDWDDDDPIVVHAVDEIADTQRRNRAIAERRADGRIGCRAPWAASVVPLPNAVLASDP